MSNDMNHERFEELKEAYALGALPENERREFEEYLAAHPERQTEVQELSSIANLLALSPEEQDPPPELRRSLLQTVRAEAPPRPSRSFADLTDTLKGLLTPARVALGGAALVVIGLISWNVALQDEVSKLQEEARSTRPVELESPSSPARGELVNVRGKMVLVVEDMPPIPANKTYQIWVIEDDVPKPAGLFEPQDGTAAATVRGPVRKADMVAITVEPEGGSPAPTSDPLLSAKL